MQTALSEYRLIQMIDGETIPAWAGAHLPPKPVIDTPLDLAYSISSGAYVQLAVYGEPGRFRVDYVLLLEEGLPLMVDGPLIGTDPFTFPCPKLQEYLRAYARIRTALGLLRRVLLAPDTRVSDEARSILAQVQLLPQEVAKKNRLEWMRALRFEYAPEET